MSDFQKCRVKNIEKTTEDAVVIELDVTKDQQNEMAFSQGQYINVQTNINGEEIRRSYSLCSSPYDKEWKIGVKQIPEGKFSTFANQELKVGDSLEVSQPEGRFTVPVSKEAQRNFLAFAAGSGITPVLSIIKTHLSQEPKSTFKLFYANKRLDTIMLKEELEDLKNLYLDRFEIFYFLTQQQRDIPFLNGRIDEEKLDIIFKTICDVDAIDHFFTCGPEDMIVMVRDYLVEKGVSKDKIHFELFHSGIEKTEEKAELKRQYGGKTCAVEIKEGGKTLHFEMEQAANNILDEALANSADLPFACKGGVCCTCRAKLLKGKVEMLKVYGLEEDEIENGYILTCQSLPVSENLIVDFDA